MMALSTACLCRKPKSSSVSPLQVQEPHKPVERGDFIARVGGAQKPSPSPGTHCPVLDALWHTEANTTAEDKSKQQIGPDKPCRLLEAWAKEAGSKARPEGRLLAGEGLGHVVLRRWHRPIRLASLCHDKRCLVIWSHFLARKQRCRSLGVSSSPCSAEVTPGLRTLTENLPAFNGFVGIDAIRNKLLLSPSDGWRAIATASRLSLDIGSLHNHPPETLSM